MMRSKNDNDDGVESTGGREEEIEPPVTDNKLLTVDSDKNKS